MSNPLSLWSTLVPVGRLRQVPAEASGDSTGAVLGKVVHMPVVVSSTGAHGLDCAEARGGSTGAFLG